MDVLNWAALVLVGVKVVSAIKLKWPNIPGWGIQCIAWVVGVLLVFLGSEMLVIQDTLFNDVRMADFNFWTKVGAGVIVASAGSFLTDSLSAIDRNRTTSI